MNDRILNLKDVRFAWPKPDGFSLSVSSFQMEKGEKLLLLGESGAGKSTLLSLICGVLVPDAGQVHVAGTALNALSAAQRDRFRAEHIGIIFQQFNLLPFGTVLDNIALPLRFAPQRSKTAGDFGQSAASLCAALKLPKGILNHKASALSVGQQQRVAVARALIGAPDLIVADEPTSALDETTQSAFLNLLFDQVSLNGSSLLMVSHDPRLAPQFDRVVHMDQIAQLQRGHS